MARKTEKPVAFIGAGPGDVELITVKGKRLLSEADTIVYAGSLVNKGLLRFRKKGARLFDSSKMELGEITSVIVEAIKNGKRVARLVSGDASLYSAVCEHIEELKKHGVESFMVPGVNSALAGASSLGIELTVPDITQTVIFTRLEGRTPSPENLSALAMHKATMCIFLSAHMIEELVAKLTKGYLPTTAVAVVHRATWKDEKIIKGTLADIAEKVKKAKILRQAVIIVGNALDPRKTHGKRSLLYDKGFKHGFRKK
ncbi:MAG: precorrin-4 C(11)-methyltransferase [Deltaproteobacteria bacterium]|nr:precorrin-4 C(11)-methyltransferase [Deltaproteobacteria bacterium]